MNSEMPHQGAPGDSPPHRLYNIAVHQILPFGQVQKQVGM